jgi:cytochrome P450
MRLLKQSDGNHCSPARGRITTMCASANRDESIFGEPEGFRLDRNPSMNMLYGADSLLSGSLTDKT